MAAHNTYKLPEHYQDQTPAPALNNRMLARLIWSSLFLQASFNYERMQACGWTWSLVPALTKIHTNKKDLAAALSSHMEFFTTHPFLVTFVMGIVLSLEQQKIDPGTIRSVRVAIMGPLGGIGDGLFWLTFVPILAGVTGQMAVKGEIAGPILFLLVFNIVQFALRIFLLQWSYSSGEKAIQFVMRERDAFTRAASVLGLFIVGALIVTMGSQTKLGLTIPNGTSESYVAHTATIPTSDLDRFTSKIYDENGNLLTSSPDKDNTTTAANITDLHNGYSQITYMELESTPATVAVQPILDSILPSLLPLAITLALYYMLSRHNWTPLKCIALIMLLALLGSGFGIWPSIWPS